MPDARGHGCSEAPEGGYAIEDQADDLEAFIQVLGLDRPRLIGHSMGASVVAAMTVQYPHRASCIVLGDPVWFDEQTPNGRRQVDLSPGQRQRQVAQWRAELRDLKSLTREEVVARGRENHPTWDEAEFDIWAEAKHQVSLRAANFVKHQLPLWSHIAPRIPCPALLVTGEPRLGAIVTSRVAREVAKLNGLIRTVRVNGAGHNIRREQFDRFVQVVAQFLARHAN
jgi:pimeloyl-ACP methyl ester carboxylesterase